MCRKYIFEKYTSNAIWAISIRAIGIRWIGNGHSMNRIFEGYTHYENNTVGALANYFCLCIGHPSQSISSLFVWVGGWVCLKVRWLRGSSDTVEAMHRSLPVLRLSFLVPTLCLFQLRASKDHVFLSRWFLENRHIKMSMFRAQEKTGVSGIKPSPKWRCNCRLLPLRSWKVKICRQDSELWMSGKSNAFSAQPSVANWEKEFVQF